MSGKIGVIRSSLGPERVKLNEKLSYHTYTKIGGPAECFYIATTQNELVEGLNVANDLTVPFCVFGSGTKMLVSEPGLPGLVIKNRTSQIKISGIKGKVGREGLGVAEALLEVDSGVTIGKLNEYIEEQNLRPISTFSSSHSTIGGTIFLDPNLQNLTQKIKVWDDGTVSEIDSIDLNRNKHIVLSAVFKIKAE